MIVREMSIGQALEPTADPVWLIIAEGHDPFREASIETRFSVSNGFLGVRGTRAVTGGARWLVPQRTYVAGLFDRPGAEEAMPVLTPAAGWLRVRLSTLREALGRHPLDVPEHRMTLDMRRGVLLTRCALMRGGGLNLRMRTMRLVSLKERAVGLQLIELEVEEGEGELTLEASFDGLTLGLASERLNRHLGVWRTQHTGKRLALAAALSLRVDGHELTATASGEWKSSWTWRAGPGQLVQFERIVSFIRCDSETSDPGEPALEKLSRARRIGWRGIVAEHEAAWSQRWSNSDIEVDGDHAAQQALRFAAYHLNSAANPDDEHVSIGARALTGDAYHGHVFWDTDVYLMPFYTFTWPEAARALLMYRFHTLNGAREKAAQMGCRGALYAWESADTGSEAAPPYVIGPDRQIIPILCGAEEHHVSADVAYAVWRYWQATGDDGFLRDAGAEIILETARFWASRAKLETDGRRHIRGVVGPDEYHASVDDSAYTNVMARWNIRRALEVVASLRQRWPEEWERLSSRLGLSDAELQEWAAAADTLADGFNSETGLFEEFEGYFGLEDINLSDYAGRSVPMDVVLGRERTRKSQVIKQADVVALLALLPEEFSADAAAKNFAYYEPRCGQGSSLSPGLHGLVAARLGDAETALRYLRKSAAIDLSDTHAAIGGGIHIAALGANWMLAVFGFGGLSVRGDTLSLDPTLPKNWRALKFNIQWRGRWLKIAFHRDTPNVEGTLEEGEPMIIVICGKSYELRRGQLLEATIMPVHEDRTV
jgi:trehalose/maltose hydrolase-like predicted phosphorylase